MAEELRQQVPVIKDVLKAMKIEIIEKEGLEADDLLGTISCMCEEKGMDVSIISGDRDTLQLATEHVKIRIPKTKQGRTEVEDYNAADVEEKYGVTPKEFIDVKALMGDAADNIPGVPGVGEKTATKIIQQYKSIENAYEHVDELKPPRASKNLKEFWEQAKMSKTLATIETHAERLMRTLPSTLRRQSWENSTRRKRMSFFSGSSLKTCWAGSRRGSQPMRSSKISGKLQNAQRSRRCSQKRGRQKPQARRFQEIRGMCFRCSPIPPVLGGSRLHTERTRSFLSPAIWTQIWSISSGSCPVWQGR